MNRGLLISIAGLGLLAATTAHIQAATKEQAVVQCREQLTPSVRSCVREKMMADHATDPNQYIPGCKAQFHGPFTACVARLTSGGGGAASPAGGRGPPGVGPNCTFQKCFDHCLEIGGLSTIIPAVGCSRMCSHRCTGHDEPATNRWH